MHYRDLSWLMAWTLAACGGRTGLEVTERILDKPCPLGFEDCDGDPENGCETDLRSSNDACGACGEACGPDTMCGAGACRAPGDVVQVASGSTHSCALRASGQVLCWGGTLGTDDVNPFPLVVRDSDVAEVTVYGAKTCIRTRQGEAWCFRYLHEPDWEQAPVLSHLAAVTPTMLGTCALDTLGRVRCWGDNSLGHLGDGTFESSAEPVAVLGLDDAVQLRSSCALRSNGDVVCWGQPAQSNYWYVGQKEPAPAPFRIERLPPSCYLGNPTLTQSVAISAAGEVFGWNPGTWPVQLPDLEGAIEVSGGGPFVCGLMASGGVRCRGGFYGYETLGNGSFEPFEGFQAFDVSGLTDATGIASGWLHTCAVRAHGDVVCWGNNTHGELGDGSTTNRAAPVSVLLPPAP